MPDPSQCNDLVRQILEAIPPGLKQVPDDIEKNIRLVLKGAFERMDLVTREEFDAQVKVLARTREKLEALEKRLAG